MKKVLLLLANGFEVYEAAVFADIIGFAKTGGVEIDLVSVGLHKNLQCAYGFGAIPDLVYPEVNLADYDALVVPGGRRESGFYEDAYNPDFLHIIQKFHKQKKDIVAVCVGTMPLGKAGILQGVKATTYPGKKRVELASYGAEVQDYNIAEDQNIITCAAPAFGLKVAFRLLEKLTSKKDAEKTKLAFGF